MRPNQKREDNVNSLLRIKPRYDCVEHVGNAAFAGKNVLVTEMQHGVGKAVAIAFAKEGANIIMLYKHKDDEKELHSLSKTIMKYGSKIWMFRSYVVDEFKCEKLFKNIVKKIPRIDIVVNILPFLNSADNNSKHYLLKNNETLLMQGLFTVGKVAPLYLHENGILINAAYICSYATPEQLMFFSAVRSSLNNFTRETQRILPLYRKNLRSHGITAGFIWGDKLPATLPDYENSFMEVAKTTTMHPCEISPLFIFLSKKEAAILSGETLDACGRMYTK